MMTFEKPDNTTYTDMAIYIDENIYKETFDVNVVYQYLYLLIYMLASHQNLLRPKYLDSFSLFAASKIYLRLTNPDQFVKTGEGKYKLKRVKSVLNYIKSSLYFLKVDFEQSEYYQEFNSNYDEVFTDFNYENVLSNTLESLHLVDFDLVMNDVPKTCESFLSRIPYVKGTPIWHNIYISVLLTFNSSLTLTYKQRKRVEDLTKSGNIKQYHYKNCYDKEELKPVLYNLSESMGPYIVVLARQLRHLVGRDLSETLRTKVDSDLTAISMFGEQFKSEQEGITYEN